MLEFLRLFFRRGLTLEYGGPDRAERAAMLRATFSSSEASKRRWSNTCGLMGRTELAQSAYRLDARSPRRITQRDTPGTTPNEQLFRTVKNGAASMMPGDETDMPAYKEILSDADIWTVLSFIESTWSADIRERQETGKLRLRIHFGRGGEEI